MALRCLWSIGLMWGSKIWENERKYTFWAFPGHVYRYTLNMYRYTLCSGRFWPKDIVSKYEVKTSEK